jgi:hypothetical protein
MSVAVGELELEGFEYLDPALRGGGLDALPVRWTA